MERFVDEAYVKPSITADGSLHFPNDFFNRVCGYFINGSVCYELATSDECEPSFRPNNIIKNFNNLSIKFCRNTDALNTLVPCLNDKESFEAYMRAIQYEGSEQESTCNVAKEQIRRILRLVKDRCGEEEYISLKTVMADIGEDLPTLFLETDDPSCSIDVSTLTPDRRRRGVASSAIKGD
ncbi:uncharacterized protein LOC130049504 [Ostrea edulis]|uniref:uncharacterized protein LOC130049504 n=1 Tax=Ostrea edulis TaxID=37623 RepID=UPI0024AF0E1D|nr:uncharacterized protein LOC130049504 [Ostrea edulis]